MIVPEKKQPLMRRIRLLAVEDQWVDSVSTADPFDISREQTLKLMRVDVSVERWKGSEPEDSQTLQSAGLAKRWRSSGQIVSSKLLELRGFIKDAGVYAFSSVIIPMISLVLAPFLTHALSTSEYGILTLLNTVISLGAGITQLGLGSAFFRAYNYDYTDSRDKRSVVATTTVILLVVSALLMIGAISTAPLLASLLLGRSSLGNLIAIAAGVIFVQNLTIPIFAWLRSENRAFLYSILSISNVLVTLLTNIALIGLLHWKIAGALIAAGSGYTGVLIIEIPVIIFRTGMRVRIDIARNLLGFGVPLIFGFVSFWILQISDRYLISYFGSSAETAKYAVAYTLGTAMSAVVIGPFTLAWPMTMFSIAKSRDAPDTFRLIFRWFGLFLLAAAFCFSYVAVLVLNWLFPVAYHSAAPVIPVIAISTVFYALYYIFAVGINIKRKVWLTSIYISIAALVNFLLNLMLIPAYGAIGAAISTLIAYMVLALVAYIVNQRIYPIGFEIGRFVAALVIGVAFYFGSSLESGLITGTHGLYGSAGVFTGALLLYTACLVVIGLLPVWKRKPEPSLLERRAF